MRDQRANLGGKTKDRPAARILVVEDDHNLSRLIQSAMRRSGIDVDVAETAAEALTSYRTRRPELVLLDVVLPDESGFDVCRKIRASFGTSTPIIFMTAKNDLRSRLEGFQSGGQDFVQKPFYVEEMLKRIQLNLQSSRARQVMASRNAQLEARDESRVDMMNIIAHDLKVPLTTIITAIKMVTEQYLVTDPILQRLMRSSHKCAENMNLLIEDIIDIGKSNQGRLDPRFENVFLEEITHEARQLFESTCVLREISIRVTMPSPAPSLVTDRRLLLRILANLLSNAVKVSKQGGEILLEFRSFGEKVFLTVADRGPGVPNSERERIFGKYQHAGKAESGYSRGSGIGLYFCRDAANGLGGAVWVEDREGGGSRFILRLPKAPAGWQADANH